MGFFGRFLGYNAIKTFNDVKKETKKYNELCYQLSDYNKYLDEYLLKVGCSAHYFADWNCIDSGSIELEKRKMDTVRKKVEEYIRLGGEPKYIHDLDDIDEYIDIIKYLKMKNALDRQGEFEYERLNWIKETIEEEEREEQEKKVKEKVEEKVEEVIKKFKMEHIKDKYILKQLNLDIKDILISLHYGWSDKKTLDEKIDECISILNRIMENDNGNESYSFYRDQVSLHIADLSLIKGDLDIAFKKYIGLLNSVQFKKYYENNENFKSEILPVIFNIIQICNIFGIDQLSKKYIDEYSEYLERALEMAKWGFESSLDDSEIALLDEDEIDDYIEFMTKSYGDEIYGYENLDKVSFIILSISTTGIYVPTDDYFWYISPFPGSGYGNKCIKLKEGVPSGIEGYADWGVAKDDMDRMKKSIINEIDI